MAGLRVVVVYGSESGCTEHVAKSMAKSWVDKDDPCLKLEPKAMCGNEAAKQFGSLKGSYDVVLVLTSSFGDGDPPDNFTKFLKCLLEGASAEEKPLVGMQHAVLGFGDSSYHDTFMNCPRLSDKLLEECGSRRCHKRYEIDAGAEDLDAMQKLEVDWQDSVFKVLKSGPAAADPPAAPWCEAGKTDKITPKTVSDLNVGAEGSAGMVIFALVMVGGAALLYWMMM